VHKKKKLPPDSFSLSNQYEKKLLFIAFLTRGNSEVTNFN